MYPGQHALVLLLLVLALFLTSSGKAGGGEVTVGLNGLDLSIDEQTGSITKLSYPATGTMLQATATTAGLIGASCGSAQLSSTYSKARVVVSKERDRVVIEWNALLAGAGSFGAAGAAVKATVTIRSASDRRSFVMKCVVSNQGKQQITSIVFPDLAGLTAIDEPGYVALRFATGLVYPFASMQSGEKNAFPMNTIWSMNEFRWLDLGSYRKGGLSVFDKRWGSPQYATVNVERLKDGPNNLRLGWEHQVKIDSGQQWTSPDFCFTPHAGGWAKGIEVFRKYVDKVNPPRQIPRHVRDGIAYQTIWMMQPPETDPKHVDFRFADIPRIAKDAKEHGIDEIVIWGWCPYFRLPIRTEGVLGTREEFLDGIRKAREIGVNVVPFVSVKDISDPDLLRRYGYEANSNGWTYHPEYIPMLNPYYLSDPYPVQFWKSRWVPVENKLWQEDVMAAFKEWIDLGVTSFSWDVFDGRTVGDGTSPLTDLVEKVRKICRAKDPQSTFSGELIAGTEHACRVLDYTWNNSNWWDSGAFQNVLPYCRRNNQIGENTLDVRRSFAMGMYPIIWPCKTDRPNGTALLSEKPALSATLKQVARLRKQFLPYFADGRYIGECVLSEAAGPDVFVEGHQTRKGILAVVLNAGRARQITVKSNLRLWLPSTGSYEIRYYNSIGKLVRTTRGTGDAWAGQTDELQPEELAFFSIRAL